MKGGGEMTGTEHCDVVIVGAGAAGVGCGAMLRDLGVTDFVILERDVVGASFRRWPAETRFISPSFHSNGFGLMDLNAVALNTSPAYTLNREHPSGREYASYLHDVAVHFELPIRSGVEVERVCPGGAGFQVDTSHGPIRARFVIWAAGEFQYPARPPFPGADLCRLSTQVGAWRDLPGAEHSIIGGGESGMDAAIHLVAAGKRAAVLASGPPLSPQINDPSLGLSPFTWKRLSNARRSERLEICHGADITRVERCGDGFAVSAADGREWRTDQPPILATGFAGSLRLIADLFEWEEAGHARLTEADESTRAPGLFVSGPMVRHGGAIFCFIYKFRQRFAVIGAEIGTRLRLDLSPLADYAAQGCSWTTSPAARRSARAEGRLRQGHISIHEISGGP